MSPGRTAQRTYHELKAQILDGDHSPGERLDPAQLARPLGTSATPVRDALHRLLGERLIEAWPREGFKIPIPSEGALRELYGWNADLVATVLRRLPPATDVLNLSREHGPPARSLFDAIAAAGTAEYAAAIHQASDRLHRARLIEPIVFVDHDEEHATLVAAWSKGAAAELAKLMARYHRRRQHEVAAIVAALLRSAPPDR